MGPIKQQPLGKVNQKRSGDFTPGAAGPSKAIQNCEQSVDLILQAKFLDPLFGFYSTKQLPSIKRIWSKYKASLLRRKTTSLLWRHTSTTKKLWNLEVYDKIVSPLQLNAVGAAGLLLLSLHIVFNSFVVCASMCIHQTLLPKKLFSKFGVICIKRCWNTTLFHTGTVQQHLHLLNSFELYRREIKIKTYNSLTHTPPSKSSTNSSPPFWKVRQVV